MTRALMRPIKGVTMNDKWIPEDQITPILPFRNPENEAEQSLNDFALSLYDNPEARETNANLSMWRLHPTQRGHVYFASIGWTSEGWRTSTSVMDIKGLIDFVDTTVEFVEKAVSVDQAVSRMEQGASLVEVALDMLADARKDSENCGDPNCPVHGSGDSMEAVATLFGKLFGM